MHKISLIVALQTANPKAQLQPVDEQQGQTRTGDREEQAQEDELPKRVFRVTRKGREVHAEVAGEERQRQEDRRDDGKRVEALRLTTGDVIRVAVRYPDPDTAKRTAAGIAKANPPQRRSRSSW